VHDSNNDISKEFGGLGHNVDMSKMQWVETAGI
jgi:hypothetical protein